MNDAATHKPATATKHLQGIGKVHAKAAGQIKAGDVLIWNYGYTSVVNGVEKTSPQYITATLVCEDGAESTRRMKIDRLVGVTKESL
jgi:hypothetical protein